MDTIILLLGFFFFNLLYPFTDGKINFTPLLFCFSFSLQCVYFEDEQTDETGFM